MDEAMFLQRCKDLVGDTEERPWTPDHMAGFFQVFRPDGQRLGALFNEIPAGAEVFRRLLQVYRATEAGWRHPDSYDGYFIVHYPEPSTRDELKRFAAAQLANWRHMAVEFKQQELIDLLTPIPDLAVLYGPPPDRDVHDTTSLDTDIYEVNSDWHLELAPMCAHAFWMKESFYYIACDYYLAGHLTWPWYRDSSSIKEPYEPYFNLWLRGAELRCKSPQNITLFAPEQGMLN